MDIDLRLFEDILRIDSTTGRERHLADMLCERLPVGDCRLTVLPSDAGPDQQVNILLTWGQPRILLCTHIDTVPPYIAPTIVDTPEGLKVCGRGTCDAKGQIMAMYTACRHLANEGYDGFGLLLLYSEETGSYGAKAMAAYPGCEYIIVGEPTDNKMVRASKGTKSFEVTITGKAFHSGYPQYGISAVDIFVDMMNTIRQTEFAPDPLLGETTYNVGKLSSDNPQNILSEKLTFRIYFRTTFASDQQVCQLMESLSSQHISIKAYGGDTPSHYMTLPGFETTTVAFGSDAPHLTHYEHKMLCGPGSILVAHRPEEHIMLAELEQAADNYVRMVKHVLDIR